MKCEVKNVQSAEVFSVPAEGMIFGRTGGPANITVSDQSVSKRHARIFCKDGNWFLEDLKSVNGTVVNNRRITEPVPLSPGFVFALSKHQFEIVALDGASSSRGAMQRGAGQNGESDPRARGGNKSSAQLPAKQRNGNGGGSQQPVNVADQEPLLPPEPSQRSRSMQPPPLQQEQSEFQGQQQQNDPYMDELQGDSGGGGAGAVMAALPKAIAYYVAAVPLMAVNPIGYVKKGIENQKLKAMGALELVAFALPIQVAGGVAGAWAGGLAVLIAGGGFSVMSFIPIVPLIIGVISSVIMGLIWHPVMKFVIERIFKGETDEKSRSNYAAMFFTASGLLQIPTAAAVLMTGIVARLLSITSFFAILDIIPYLIMALTTPLMPFISWQWFKFWRTAKWAQTLMLVFLVLALVGGVFRALDGIKLAVTLIRGGGGTTVVVNDADAKKAAEEAQRLIDEAKKAGAGGDDGKKAGGDDGKKAGGDDGKKAGGDDGKKAGGDDGKKAGGDDGKKAGGDDGKKAGGDDGKKAGGDDGKKAGGDDGKKDDPPTTSLGGGAYGSYRAHRDEIDRRLKQNPTIMLASDKRLSAFGEAYQRLIEDEKNAINDAKATFAGKTKKGKPDFSQLPRIEVMEPVIQAYIFQRTGKEAEIVYSKLPAE